MRDAFGCRVLVLPKHIGMVAFVFRESRQCWFVQKSELREIYKPAPQIRTLSKVVSTLPILSSPQRFFIASSSAHEDTGFGPAWPK
jgi:hypothetical protein